MNPDSKKRGLGQYFTKGSVWMKDNIRNFILESQCSVVYDPFAGSGDLLKAVQNLGYRNFRGMDIDESLGWEFNDSLSGIPTVQNAIIVTNPPYLSNYSAKRRHIYGRVKHYFEQTRFDDLYLLALSKMLEAQEYVVAIVPETFVNSPFPKERLYSINILEENPFTETESPVCVACFDGISKPPQNVKVYKNGHYSSTLGDLEAKRLHPSNEMRIRFNSTIGNIGLRAVDTTDPSRKIRFTKRDELDYDMSKIKASSRIITVIDAEIPDGILQPFIEACNQILEKYRKDTDDILLSPFKGNMKNGIRRRRLDYYTCRAIMEIAYKSIVSPTETEGNCNLHLIQA